MMITTHVTIHYDVYKFFEKASTYAKRTPEELMSDALLYYAGVISEMMLDDMQDPDSSFDDGAPPNTPGSEGSHLHLL